MRLQALALCALLVTGCAPQPGPLPEPRHPAGVIPDPGFAIAPRQACTAEVAAALEGSDVAAIERASVRGVNFTCGAVNVPLPLDAAVMQDNVDRVRALLAARADPNARWTAKGDRFPLQETLDAGYLRLPIRHRVEIVQLLLDHGADPNQRWCQGYGGRDKTCDSEWGTTPLLAAAQWNDPTSVLQLLKAGADPLLENSNGVNALDRARGEAVFYLLLSAIPDARPGRAGALAYLSGRHPHSQYVRSGPWDETPLTRAIAGSYGDIDLGPPPPPDNREALGLVGSDYRIGRVRALLSVGADPNQRLTSDGVDWTPLALAIAAQDVELVVTVMRHGADLNGRWCVPVGWTPAEPRANSTCEIRTGITPLMFAATLENAEIVRWLLRQGADLTLRDWANRTALDYATRARRTQAVHDLEQAARFRALTTGP